MNPQPARHQIVLGTALLMIGAHVAFRAWALYPSWFYQDDYRLLGQARSAGFGIDYLTTPFDSQFMPVGRAIAWWVAHGGDLNWGLTATLTLALQVGAASMCAVMLFTLFGVRARVLIPLAIYLTSAVAVPATMWWAASLNQLPIQIVLFGSVATWVRYLRGDGRVWLAATAAILALGLLSYVKGLLVFGVLVFVMLAYFVTGGPVTRVVEAVRRWRPAAVALGVLGIGYGVYYATEIPQAFATGGANATEGLASGMLGVTLPVGLVGGPWQWDDFNPPTSHADPPSWAVVAAWLTLLGIVLGCYLTRRRSLRGWALLVGYALIAYLLVAQTRAQVVGSIAGYEYRYLTDVLPVFVLVLALALTELRGAVDSTVPRPGATTPEVLQTLRRAGAVGVVAAVVGGLVSCVAYVGTWHHDNPGDAYIRSVRSSMIGQGDVDLVDQVLPGEVMSGLLAPDNTTARLLPLFAPAAHFPAVSMNLGMLDEGGNLRQALISPDLTDLGRPEDECGWRVQGARTEIPLTGLSYDYDWWVRISYLASGSDAISIQAGETSTSASVHNGVGAIYAKVSGQVSSVVLTPSRPDTVMCVGDVNLGQPQPGAPF